MKERKGEHFSLLFLFKEGVLCMSASYKWCRKREGVTKYGPPLAARGAAAASRVQHVTTHLRWLKKDIVCVLFY